jgi:hypothetical protein
MIEVIDLSVRSSGSVIAVVSSVLSHTTLFLVSLERHFEEDPTLAQRKEKVKWDYVLG